MRLAKFCFALVVMPSLVVAASKAAPPSKKFPVLNNTIGLAHRWSFQEDLKDSVGRVDAVLCGSAQLKDGAVRTFGGEHQTSWVDIPGDMLPSDRSAFTLEIWATPVSVQYWSRLFNLHFSPGQFCNRHGWRDLCWAWFAGKETDKSIFRFLETNALVVPGFEIGKRAHVFLMGRQNEVTGSFELAGYVWYDGSEAAKASFVVSTKMESRDYDSLQYLVLGKSPWKQDSDADAIYEEVRIWNRAFTEEDMRALNDAGPNALPKLSKMPVVVYDPVKEPQPTWFCSEKLFTDAFVKWKMLKAGDKVQKKYKGKIGGMSDYRRDMAREAKNMWKSMIGK